METAHPKKEVVVLVHGLFGFGPDELGQVSYWKPILETFPKDKFDIFEASVGAISSNWDRACELWSQIKGGTVNYGKYHSIKCNHYSEGHTYDGFYPEWNENNPIHLIGHSMGGQTIRMLEHLLNEGDSYERKYLNIQFDSLFYGGRKGWIKSLSCVSTPHNGTPILDLIPNKWVDVIKDQIVKIAIQNDKNTNNLFYYKFDLDQFGLTKSKNESIEQYKERLNKHPIWKQDYKDIASWDLSPDGSKELNILMKQTYPETYYFSIATYTTIAIPWMSIFPPKIGYINTAKEFTSPYMIPTANILGYFKTPKQSRKNDGLVPYESSKAPTYGYNNESDNVIKYKNKWEKGKWQWIDIPVDHTQVIGFTVVHKNLVYNMYKEHLERINEII